VNTPSPSNSSRRRVALAGVVAALLPCTLVASVLSVPPPASAVESDVLEKEVKEGTSECHWGEQSEGCAEVG
jgi:hypothetical protein